MPPQKAKVRLLTPHRPLDITETEKMVDQHNHEKRFKTTFEYLGNHAGGFTLLSTLLIGIISIIFKGLVYAFMCGKYDFWRISHSYINITNENMLYEIFIYAAFAMVYIAINMIPFKILTTPKKGCVQILKVSVLLLITSIIIAILISISVSNTDESAASVFHQLPAILIFSVVLSTLLYLSGIVYGFSERSSSIAKDNKTNESPFLWYKLIRPNAIIALFIGISLYAFFAYGLGYHNASTQRTTKLIQDDKYSYAVILENSEKFIISKCEVEDNILNIDHETQKLISANDVETTIATFRKIVRK